MLRQLHRLRREQDFRKTYKWGQRMSSPHLRLFILPRQAGLESNQNISRFGFVVSKKATKKIVQRNRLKRILRAAVRPLLPKISESVDIIIQGQSSLLELSLREVQSELERLFKQAKLIS